MGAFALGFGTSVDGTLAGGALGADEIVACVATSSPSPPTR
jgi:hypothetical protein